MWLTMASLGNPMYPEQAVGIVEQEVQLSGPGTAHSDCRREGLEAR